MRTALPLILPPTVAYKLAEIMKERSCTVADLLTEGVLRLRSDEAFAAAVSQAIALPLSPLPEDPLTALLVCANRIGIGIDRATVDPKKVS